MHQRRLSCRGPDTASQMEKDKIPLIRPPRPKKGWWTVFRRLFDDIRSQFSNDPLERCRWRTTGGIWESVSEKPKDQLGRAGEEEAAYFLEEKGYRIIQRNLRLDDGEIDIVAAVNRTLVFFEVKTRRSDNYGEPFEAVTDRKRKRMVALASRFLTLHRLVGIPVRFDVLDVVWPEDGPPRIVHFCEAFRVNDLYR